MQSARRSCRRLQRALPGAMLAVALFLGLARAAPAAVLDEGQQAAVITGTDFLTGEKIDLANDLGKRIILLDFGSIYCSSCMVTVPNLVKLRKKYPVSDLAILNIYLDVYNPQRTMKFFRGFEKNLQLHLLIDEKLAISRDYGVENLPTTIVIGHDGTIVRRIVGYTENEEKEINGIIEGLVRELPVARVSGPGAAGEDVLTIFSPESFTKTSQDKIYVVGYLGGGDARSVSLRLNNLPARTVTTKNNVFHFRTPLSLALNFLEIEAQGQQGQVRQQSLVIFREIDQSAGFTSDLPSYRFHLDEEKRPCRKCHQLDQSQQDHSYREQNDLCVACHTSFALRLFTHDPLSEGGCLSCHDAESFPGKYELKSQGVALCYSCHDTIEAATKKLPFIHGPVAAGLCLACHDPHGTNERSLLPKRLDLFCLSCHQEMVREFAEPVVHTPAREGACMSCHLPHGSKQRMLLYKPLDRLCVSCHDLTNRGHTHQIGVAVKTSLWPQGLLTEEGTTACYTCHTHHSSKLPKLLRGPKGECSPGCHAVESPGRGR